MLAADTGEAVARLPDRADECRTDGRTVIACGVLRDEPGVHRDIATFDVKTGKTATTTVDVAELKAVLDGGRIVVGDRSRAWSIDARARSSTKDVPSSVLSMAFTDHHAIRSPDDGGPAEVYEVLS